MLPPKLNLKLNNQSKTNNTPEREAEEFWANIGFEVEVEDESGATVTKFISINYGIPLSSVPDMKKGNNLEWNALCDAKNDLRNQMIELAKGLKPGSAETMPITLQIRRVGEAPSITADENPFLVKLSV